MSSNKIRKMYMCYCRYYCFTTWLYDIEYTYRIDEIKYTIRRIVKKDIQDDK